MSQPDPCTDTPLLNWSDLGVSELLPTGTVTLLLADVEGSTRLWETQSEEMTAAVARLDRAVADLVTAHGGVRPVEQGEGDSFVVAFARASDAVSCALELQRAPLAPIRLRIGVHTGEVQLRDESNYIGPTINRTARLRDLAHGGQTVVSGTTEDLVVDILPTDAWLVDLGRHELRGVSRPERVVQLCHPDLRNEFPPLRTEVGISQYLPAALTSFVGRQEEAKNLREVLAASRLVTLTGAGGVGKTRLAVHIAAELAGGFDDGVRYVDLAPITIPDVVPVAVARTLGLPDRPGCSTMETLLRFVRERHLLLVLDNCEHLLDASATLAVAILEAASRITLLATSREPLGVAGEATWQVPSLSLTDEAIELFADRARLARADFTIAEDNAAVVTEICRRLDGMPLAIELAAARVRALSLTEIVDSLHDRFRLLTGGSRTAVRRQQTLRASVDWSHALLTDTERILFRRVAVFLGGFDLDAAQAVAGAGEIERYQVLDQLTLLVEKSLVVAENTGGRTRYRLLETVRQYALEKLGESGEADAVRSRHRDYYTAMTVMLDAPARTDYEDRGVQAEVEMDNLRAAFGWCLENSETEQALTLASSLQPFWISRGRVREGRSWFDTALANESANQLGLTAPVRVRSLADKAVLGLLSGASDSKALAEEALALAREGDDPTLLARALTACGYTAAYTAEAAAPYFAEAAHLARESGDYWRLSQTLTWQANGPIMTGEPAAARAAAEAARDLADAMGDRFGSRNGRVCLGWAQLYQGDLVDAVAQFRAVAADCEAAHDPLIRSNALAGVGFALAWQGETYAARTAAEAGIEVASELSGIFAGVGYGALTAAALAAGDVEAAQAASEMAWQHLNAMPGTVVGLRPYIVQAALAAGDLTSARRKADDAITTTTGWHLMMTLTARARIAIAQDDLEDAERDAHEALACATDVGAYLGVSDTLECLGAVASQRDSHREAARLFGAAHGIGQRMGAVRFKVWDADYETSVAALREALGDTAFDAAWAEGAVLSIEEAITYAQRGRGERKRPSSGWASLTPAERDVVRLVGEGLANKEIATRLFVSPRTVETHLSHVYAKLSLSSRVQLAQEAARHS